MALSAGVPDEPLLDRAGRLMRERPVEGWPEVSSGVRRRLRSVVAPAQEFTAYADQGRPGSRVTVTSRVLLPALRARLDSDRRVADAIDLVPARDARDRLGVVRIDLVCGYGTGLLEQGSHARRIVGEVVREVLGDDPAFDADRDVTVRVVDVVEGDPRLS